MQRIPDRNPTLLVVDDDTGLLTSIHAVLIGAGFPEPALLSDGGQALNDPAMKVIEMSQNILLVTLLSLPCLTNTRNVLKSLAGQETFSKDRLGLIVNRYLKKSDLTLQEAKESVRAEIFWNIPNDYKTTMSAINRGVPLHDLSPKANITKSLISLADSFLDDSQKEAKPKRWGLFS